MRVFEKLFGKKQRDGESAQSGQPKCAICRKDIPIFIDPDGKVDTDANGIVLTTYKGKRCVSCHRLICNDCLANEFTKAFTPGTFTLADLHFDKCNNCGGKLVSLMSINLP